MYRIVIAEDEEDVRAIIKKHINNSDTEYHVVGEAENGWEALELIQKLQPDILLTDICMPNLSGLELIHKIIETDSHIQTIIISGYDEFSYAREAMELGVKSYLLKPFLPRELFAALDKVKSGLQQQEQMIRNIQKMNQQIEEGKKYSRERLLKRLLEGSLSTEELKQKEEEIGMNRKAVWYAVGMIRFLELDGKKRAMVEQKILEQLLQIIKDNYFPASIQSVEVEYDTEQMVLLFSTENKSASFLQENIKEGFQKINSSMEKYYSIKVKCTLSRIYSDLEKSKDAYQEAAEVWKYVLHQNESVLFYSYQEQGKKEHDVILQRPEELEKELLLNIQLNKKSQAIANINQILEYYADSFVRNTEFVSVSLIQLVLQISDITLKAGGNLSVWEDKSMIDFLKKQIAFGSLLDARAVLEEYVIRCSNQFASIHENQGDKLVGNIKSLIGQNLDNEEFGLEMVAEQLHFSSNYIRQLFKSRTGESFTDYLFRSRMELAEKLLENPHYRIQDIATRTGYSDQRYFSRCFRKYKNCTPTEYRTQKEISGF